MLQRLTHCHKEIGAWRRSAGVPGLLALRVPMRDWTGLKLILLLLPELYSLDLYSEQGYAVAGFYAQLCSLLLDALGPYFVTPVIFPLRCCKTDISLPHHLFCCGAG